MTFTLDKEEVINVLVCVRERRDRLSSVITVTELSDSTADLKDLRTIVQRCNDIITKLGSEP